MNEKIQEELAGYLREGDEDDIGLWEIRATVHHSILGLPRTWDLSSIDEEKILQGVLDFVRLMLQNGFVAGDGVDQDFAIWPDQSPEYVVGRIRQEWQRLMGDRYNIGFIAYFRKVDKQPVQRR